MDDGDRLLTRGEAAALLNLSKDTLIRWARRGVGPKFYRLGGQTRYPLTDLLAWLEEHAVGGKPS